MLKRYARQTGVTEAEIIRRALDAEVQRLESSKEREGAWREESAFINEWMSKGPVAGRRRWRREDLYDRGRLA